MTIRSVGAPAGAPRGAAIVGIAALFPRARSLSEYWSNLVGGVDCIEDVPPSRWRVDDYFDPDPDAPDKTYARRGGFVPDLDLDPLEFGMPPRTIEHVDSAQLLSLVVARDALADAGLDAASAFDRERTGVVLGVAGTTMKMLLPLAARLEYPAWARALRAAGVDEAHVPAIVDRLRGEYVEWDEDAFPGFLANVVAGRIASRLDLGGVTCAVDAACASSLAAVRVALGELETGACDVVVAGGVDTDNSIAAFVSFSKTPALSHRQEVRPFDADADGTLIAEGIGMVVLKRAADAVRDGDRIYAVIRSVGASSDGRSKSIYAPRRSGQERALRDAYAQAGLSPADVGLVEAHGTGTLVGDTVEVEALHTVFEEAGAGAGSVALGSVKSQIGHTKAAAGIASLIKAAVAVHQEVLPPTLHVERPHPKLRVAESPFKLALAPRPWLGTGPRRAGVSAFGFGGANYHAVLEQAPASTPWRRLRPTPRVVLLAAAGERELVARCRELRGARLADLEPDLPREVDARVGFLAADDTELAACLDAATQAFAAQPGAPSWHHPAGIWYAAHAQADGRVVAVFPGQGSQYPGMGLQLALDFPELRRALERFDASFAAAGHAPLSAAMLDGDEAALRHTLYAQASVGALSLAAWTLLHGAGLRPSAALGHSFGELTALRAAGVLDDDAFFGLVQARGEALTPPPGADGGTLLAVDGWDDDVERLLREHPEVTVANVNSPRQVVVGGPTAAVVAAAEALAAAGRAVQPLPVGAGFHTASVAYARGPWHDALTAAELRAPAFPVYAGATGARYPADAGAVLADQPFQPVLFRDAVEAAYRDGGRVFVEIGPRAVLTRLIEQTLGERPHLAVPVCPSREANDHTQLLQAAVRLRVAGVPLGELDPYAAPVPRQVEPSEHAVRISAAPLRTDPPPPAALPLATTRGGGLLHDVQALRAATLDAHREYLTGQAERARLLLDLAAREASATPAEAARLRATIEAIGAEEAQLLRVHEQFLRDDADIARRLLGLTGAPEPPAAVAPPPPPPPPPPPMERPAGGADEVLRVVSEKTGYPPSLLEPAMELEADLGIDSIKRVEIFSALAHRLPQGLRRDELAALRTIGEIVALVDAAPAAAAPPPPPAGATDAVLGVVAEKTGYPPSLLEPAMELEADLGIDSIKRVEILSALRDLRPGTPDPSPETVRSCRTIADLVELVEGAAVAAPAAVSRLQAALRPLPPVDGEAALPEGHVVLVRSDGTDLTQRVAGLLAAPVVLLPPGAPALPDDVHQVRLADLGEDAFAQAVARIDGALGPIAAYVHLQPPGLDHDASREASRHALLAAKRLQPMLTRTSPAGRRAFVAVTRLDGALGHGDAPFDPLAAGVHGLVQALRHEWPTVHCRAVDAGPDPDASLVVAELLDPDGSRAEVGLGAGRVALDWVPAAPPAGASALGSDSVVLATGGARGVTAACVVELARRHRCRFLLLGRTTLGEEPAWARDCDDAIELRTRAEGGTPREIATAVDRVLAAREVASTLAAVEAAGGTAEYVAADVGDAAAVAAALAGRAAPTVVLHAAGALADRLVEQKTAADFDAVYRPKVDGLANVLGALDLAAVETCVVFGSTAGVFGNAGQTDYALANAILDRTALALAREGRPRMLAVDWGPWDGGMVTPELRERFRLRGIDVLALDAGARVLADELAAASGAVQLVVAAGAAAPSPAPASELAAALP